MKTVLAFTLLFLFAAFVVINYTTSAKNNDSNIELKSNMNSEGNKKMNNISTIKVKDMDGKESFVIIIQRKSIIDRECCKCLRIYASIQRSSRA